jgi:transcriptional regulator with PAS, ATPase and Fis domain
MARIANNKKTPVSPQVGRDTEENIDSFIGVSKAALEIRETVLRFASDPMHKPILITGERGTGKDLLARIIFNDPEYTEYNRKFLRINCGALHKDTIQSDLFGHEKGAYTGADTTTKGCLSEADGGTIFFNEVGNMSLNNQQIVLDAVETGKGMAVGSTKETNFNIRLICATNRNLHEMCENKEFLPDLLDRLNYRRIHIPPLRSRREDIPLLIDHLMEKYNRLYKMTHHLELHPQALKLLLHYDFPGNMRELDHIIDNAFLLVRSLKQIIIRKQHLCFDQEAHYQAEAAAETDTTGIMKVIIRYIVNILIQNKGSWENIPVEDVPCLFDMKVFKKLMIKIVYNVVGHHKGKAAKILGFSDRPFDSLD